MPTCRLSEVITGCGGKLMTCSRRSMVARTRSTNGTSRLSPGDRVRLYRPSRSITFAWACGTIVTLLARTIAISNAITITAMRTGSIGSSLRRGRSPSDDLAVPVRRGHAARARFTLPRSFERVADDRRRAVDLQDPHGLADGEALATVLAAGRPLVGAHADPAAG